mmetsp:Transcript_21743/g.30728  ORF Transcript_21743/g.30728 Transcript_21743/m.30728 type:complete len:188 (+) Transcript_21743:34-597(+)|eukprot:CAMPEP_0175094714 /NCGR_PEP_ID=MMETSP0086_2-20121207/3749_1 /TAXON_ID=136419 /ORGANISM="Unknown Unknown, Strain D1" /LENGTH=187 /DNA_ID=CAMNT_0016367873 /DNA_START=47 /DNA_END=610 /DNA_ORIENTATION=+
MPNFSPADVLKFDRPTEDFLCPLEANTYGVEFLAFKIREMDTKEVIFEVAKDPDAPPPQYPPDFDYNLLRTIRYKFPSSFLRAKTVGTMLRFQVGPQPLKNFRMIERHYFKNQLVKSYDFNFVFCMPSSTNEWEAIYDMPDLAPATVQDMLTSEEGTHSDSFYFVDGELIMHNKASYTYYPEEEHKI